MDIYQEMLEKLTKELNKLEGNFGGIKERKEIAEREHKEIKDKSFELYDKIAELRYQTNELLYSKNFKISVCVGIIAIAFLIISLLLCGYFSMLLGNYLETLLLLTGGKAIAISGLLMMMGTILFGVIDIILFNKLQNTLERKVYNKFIKSAEYKDLLKKIEVSKIELGKILDKEAVKQTRMRIADVEYTTCVADISTKKSLISYIQNDMNPQIIQEEEKPYTRKKIDNRRNI